MTDTGNPDNGAPQASANPDPRRCNYLRDTGEHCQGWRYKASTEGYCPGHARLGIAANPHAYAMEANAKSAAVRKERAEQRRMSTLDVLAARLAANAEVVADAYESATRAGDYKAADLWVTRVHGKPKETIETITTGALDALTDEQLEARAQELRARMHAVDASAQAA